VEPAGGLGPVGVNELDHAAFGVGEAGFHDGYDDFAVAEGGFHLGAGVEDVVVVRAGGDDAGVQDEGFVFVRGREAGFGKDVRDERAGVGFVGVAVRVVDVDRDLREGDEVFDGDDGDAALKVDGDGF